MAIENIRDLSALVSNDPSFAAKIAANPEAVINDLAAKAPPPVFRQEPWIYRGIVIVLSLVLLAAFVAVVVFSYSKLPIPDVVISFGSAALGALAGLLAPSP